MLLLTKGGWYVGTWTIIISTIIEEGTKGNKGNRGNMGNNNNRGNIISNEYYHDGFTGSLAGAFSIVHVINDASF